MRTFTTLTLVTLAVSCRPTNTGKIEATELGDLSHAEADRTPATRALDEACGEPVMATRAPFVREPYLQQTTTSSTRVLWSSTSSAATRVVVTTPEGEVVAEIAPEDGESGVANARQYMAVVNDLEPERIYCYAIVGEADEALIENVGFRTAPRAGAPVRFAVLGDSGEGTEDQATLLEQIPTVPLDFLLHVGDMAYETGTYEEFQANYFDYYAPILRHFSVFAVPGNHEYDSPGAAPFRRVFDLPGNERYYSFDWGDAHFVGLDTEQVGPEQIRFLKSDLAATDQPWKIVFLHKPPFSSGSHGSETSVREAFSPIFEEYGVDLVVAGHDHHYERVKPQGGVRYVVTGGGGAETYPVTPSDFTGFAQEVVHFLYVEIADGELVVHAIDATGQEFDQLSISQ